jgi:hypothetical protein
MASRLCDRAGQVGFILGLSAMTWVDRAFAMYNIFMDVFRNVSRRTRRSP